MKWTNQEKRGSSYDDNKWYDIISSSVTHILTLSLTSKLDGKDHDELEPVHYPDFKSNQTSLHHSHYSEDLTSCQNSKYFK